MTCAKKEPCKECPWRKNSAPGWLGKEDPEYFYSVFQQDYPYPCHKTIGTDNEHVCTGLVFTRINGCKRAFTEPLRSEEARLRGIKNNCFDNVHEFMKHHAKRSRKDG